VLLDRLFASYSANTHRSLVNAFAYWQGQPADTAHKTYFDDMGQAINHIQKVAGDNADKIQIITGETGWPTGKSISSTRIVFESRDWYIF
jgi:Exo-beta-1,3-glucanase